MLSFPAALVLGITGIINDKLKTPAVITTIISGILMILFALMVTGLC